MTHKVTDLISYYNLPSTIVRHPTHKLLKAAYSFYNVPGKYKLADLMSDALAFAKEVSHSHCVNVATPLYRKALMCSMPWT